MSMRNSELAIVKVFLLTLSLYCSGCYGANNATDLHTLDDIVACVRDTPNAEDQPVKWQIYFDCFPASYERFSEVFGYQEINGEAVYAPLYYNSQIYIIEAFYGTKKHVGAEAFARKLVHLATTARQWYADAPSALQYVLQTELQKDRPLYLAILSDKDANGIRMFWNFLFDGPHGVHLKDTYCKDQQSTRACQVLSAMMAE